MDYVLVDLIQAPRCAEYHLGTYARRTVGVQRACTYMYVPRNLRAPRLGAGVARTVPSWSGWSVLHKHSYLRVLATALRPYSKRAYRSD